MSKGKVIGAIVGLVVVGGAVAAFALQGSGAVEVSAEDAIRGDLSVTVSASGQVGADERVDLYPPTAGTIASIEVTEGQQVTAGTVIARLDTDPIEVQLAQAEAAYAGAKAQREAAAKSVPGKADKDAAQAAVNTAWSAYELANTRYEAAKAGLGAPTPTDIANAQAAVAVAQASYDAAKGAYDSFYTNVYLPTPEPRDPALETALAALALARDQAAANVATAQQSLAALMAASNTDAAVAAAKAAKDQAYAAYLAAKSQQAALAKASGITAALNSADQAIDAAEAARALASSTLERAEIVAPRDGVVLFNAAGGAAASLLGGGGSAGAKPAEGSSVSPAAAPFSIVDFDTLMFSAQIDEADIARVEPGMTATIELDGIDDREFVTEVERIDKQSVLTSTGGTAFTVHFLLKNAEDLLLGMNGSVEVEVDTVISAVTVPVEALLEEGTTSFVYRVVDGKAIYTEVGIGRLTDTRAEMLSGISEGDTVITSGVAELEDGDPVRIR